MPMGIVSEEDFDSEKDKLIPTQNESPSNEPKGEIKDVNRGRGVGSVKVPNSLRNIIGEESSINGRDSALELAQQFGLSPSSVSAYNAGATSTSSYDRRPNEPIINEAKTRVAKRARSKLMKALHHITEEKLSNANAKDLSGIAKDMSAIVQSMEPEVKGPVDRGNNGPTFVFYAPQVKREETYDIVHVKE